MHEKISFQTRRKEKKKEKKHDRKTKDRLMKKMLSEKNHMI